MNVPNHPGLRTPPRVRRHRSDRAGVMLVEFAIVANVLFLTLFTCMEFARMNMARNLAQDAAYFAARVAIVPGATVADAQAEANRIMSSMFTNGYTVSCSPITDLSASVTVQVQVRLNQVAFFTPLFLGNCELSSSATMRTERYSGFFTQ